MWHGLFELKPSARGWHLPVLAGLSVGIPLLGGYALGHIQEGKLAALAGLVILYLFEGSFARSMVTLMACSLAFMVSFTVGMLFSFDPFVSCVALGVWAFLVHLAIYYFRLLQPPGNFFFIMLASVALGMPFSPQDILPRIGLVSVGTMIACALGLFYCMLRQRRPAQRVGRLRHRKDRQLHVREATIFGLFIGLSLLVALWLGFRNPYWVPTSCMAVMQGASTKHVWQRGIQRILGTLIGLGLTWLILLAQPSSLALCLGIVAIQIVVELLIVRNYGLAVIFLTIMTIFLAEPTAVLGVQANAFILARFQDIVTGSAIGMAGGWLLHTQWLRRETTNTTTAE